jgi:Glycosyl transferase family 2
MSPTLPPTVSVVMPTRGRSELVARSMAAALADPATTELIAVLDERGEGERPETIAARLAALDPRVHVVQLASAPQGRRGQAARDEGARAAQGELVVALDEDVVACPGTITGHTRHHAKESQLAVVGYMPVMVATGGRFRQPAARYYSSSYEREVSRFRNDPDSILERLWGGHLSLRRQDWLSAADLSRGRGGYHDDRVFGLALRELGLRGVFDPALRAEHWYSRSISQFVRDARDSAAGEHAIGASTLSSNDRRAARVLQRAARGPLTWAMSVSAASALALGAAALGFERAEDLAARALWRLGRERGYFDARREAGHR